MIVGPDQPCRKKCGSNEGDEQWGVIDTISVANLWKFLHVIIGVVKKTDLTNTNKHFINYTSNFSNEKDMILSFE